MPYCHRVAGEIVGLYNRPQPGRAEEHVAEHDAEVTAFRATQARPPAAADPLAELLIDKGLITRQELEGVQPARAARQ